MSSHDLKPQTFTSEEHALYIRTATLLDITGDLEALPALNKFSRLATTEQKHQTSHVRKHLRNIAVRRD